jgi:DNA modification methylase
VQTHAYPEASGHFATFPPALVDPCVRIGSSLADWVLDPFVGSGTTALTAGLLGRKSSESN